MIRIRRILTLAAAALALSAAVQAPAHAQQSTVRWRGDTRNHLLIDEAVRAFGYNPARLSRREVQAIEDAWAELLPDGGSRDRLNRTQATAIVYMALVHPGDGRYGHRGDGANVPPRRDAVCRAMEDDVDRLAGLVAQRGRVGPAYVGDPDRARARELARDIQDAAGDCRAPEVAQRASEVASALSAPRPGRDELSRRVSLLREAIRRALPEDHRRR